METFAKLAIAFATLVWLIGLAYLLFRRNGADDSRPWLRFGLSPGDALMHALIAFSVLAAVHWLLQMPVVPVFTIAGFLCVGAAVVFHNLRTKTKYSWESVRHPMTRPERLGFLYGIVFILGSIAAV